MLGDGKGEVMDKDCQNLHHPTGQYIWIQTVPTWAEHRASPLIGIRVRQGETQISRLELWSLIKGVAAYSNCLFIWLYGGFYLRAEQFLWEEAAVEERGENCKGPGS